MFTQKSIRLSCLLVLLSAGLNLHAQKIFSLYNSLNISRTDELIVLKRSELEQQLGMIPDGKYIRLIAGGWMKKGVLERDKSVPVTMQFDDLDKDGKWDEAVFLYSFQPRQKVYFEASVAAVPDVDPVDRAHARMRKKNADNTFGPDQVNAVMPPGNPPTDFSKQSLPPWLTEGPAWENDKVAFRLYFDTRNNKDIYGKTTARMMMDTVGANPAVSYHTLSDWGMDILKVGNSLGAGALALILPDGPGSDTLIKVGGDRVKKEYYEKQADGPVRAVFSLYYDLEIGDHLMHLSEQISIWGGQYFYESKIYVTGAPRGTRLVTGIANFYNNKPGNFKEGNAEVLYSHGQQSENKDMLGMAVLADRHAFVAFGSTPVRDRNIPSTYTLSQEVVKGEPVDFRFYAGWERTDPVFHSADGFTRFLQTEAQRYSKPVELSWELTNKK